MGNADSKLVCNSATKEDATTISIKSLDSFMKQMETIKAQTKATKETVDARTERYVNYFTLDKDSLSKVMESFFDELGLGLDMHKRSPNEWKPEDCSFKMLDSCVHDVPTGDETGVYYAIDFGGTNLRTVRVELKGNSKYEMDQYKVSLASGSDLPYPKGLMDAKATAMQLFDFFAASVKYFMKQKDDLNKDDVKAGFTFSFPITQQTVDSATLMEWTKGFETGRATADKVEGSNVADLMNKAFIRSGTPARINCILNDTVGTLLSCGYTMDHDKYPDCYVGTILGTGMNTCYFEKDATHYGYKGRIINLECGNFNRDLPRTNVDLEVDFAAYENRGYQLLEKMVSGAYMGEICRRTFVKILQHLAPAKAWDEHTLSAEDAAQCVKDKGPNFSDSKKIANKAWGADLDKEHAKILHRVCEVVYDRSAGLAAAMIAACCQKTGKLQKAMGGVTVGIDGSLYGCNQWYRDALSKYLEVLLGKDSATLIHCQMADDGSGKGAAILAAVQT